MWDEVDFENAVWSIPKERMKRSKAHNVYLAQQAVDMLIALKTCAGNSKYLLPSRYEANAPMSRATFMAHRDPYIAGAGINIYKRITKVGDGLLIDIGVR